MSAEADYIQAERKNVESTIDLIEDLLGKQDLSKYEVIALGKLLQDIYTGIERILRFQLESRGIKIRKTESWYKEMLLMARDESLVSQEQFEVFRNLLLFRHLQIHGYGYMLEKQRLLQIARPVPTVCRDFLSSVSP